ncbi:MAG: preprotein translocase subunit SecG [Planctomycetota bacterium]
MLIILYIILGGVTLVMGLAILLQEPKQAGLGGSFGMGGDQMLGARSPNALSRFTGMLSVAFLVLCLGIGLLDKVEAGRSSIDPQAGDQSGMRTSVEPVGTTPEGDGAIDGATDGASDGATDGGATDGADAGATDAEAGATDADAGATDAAETTPADGEG